MMLLNSDGVVHLEVWFYGVALYRDLTTPIVLLQQNLVTTNNKNAAKWQAILCRNKVYYIETVLLYQKRYKFSKSYPIFSVLYYFVFLFLAL